VTGTLVPGDGEAGGEADAGVSEAEAVAERVAEADSVAVAETGADAGGDAPCHSRTAAPTASRATAATTAATTNSGRRPPAPLDIMLHLGTMRHGRLGLKGPRGREERGSRIQVVEDTPSKAENP
jgi:hypothetical protein